jgi:hypothetical protein
VHDPRRLNVKNRYGFTSVVLALALPFVASMAWADEAGKAEVTKETEGGIGCMMQDAESRGTGCARHEPAAAVDQPEALTPCGMSKAAADKPAKTRSRPAMDGRAGGWPRNHSKRLSGAETAADTEQPDALKHGGCS